MSPWLRLLLARPDLLAAHVQAHALLAADDLAQAATRLRCRLWWTLGAALSAGVGAVLAGVGAMLGAVWPAAWPGAAWALAGGPLLAALSAIVCLVGLRRDRAAHPEPAFAALRRQLQADLDLLHDADGRG